MKKDKYKIITIGKEYSDLKLDKFLYSIFSNTNNTLIQKALRNKDILVNEQTVKNNYHLKLNDNVMFSDFIIKIFNCTLLLFRSHKSHPLILPQQWIYSL